MEAILNKRNLLILFLALAILISSVGYINSDNDGDNSANVLSGYEMDRIRIQIKIELKHCKR